ncbi:MAG: L,D-transpeptidase, partial [Actinomycetes bacterium]
MNARLSVPILMLASSLTLGAAALAPAASAASPNPATVQPKTTAPNAAADLSDAAIVAKLRGWGLPTGLASSMNAENVRALCVWRELNGKTATRKAPTSVERATIAAASGVLVFAVPQALRNVPLMTNSTCQTAIYQTGGTVIRVIPISTGKFQGGTRKNGMFRVFAKSPGWQSSPSFPDKFGRPNIYNGIYFFGPLAIHGSPDPIKPYPQSHGCTRTKPSDQDWL